MMTYSSYFLSSERKYPAPLRETLKLFQTKITSVAFNVDTHLDSLLNQNFTG